MKRRKRRTSGESVLHPVSAESLRGAAERLRAAGTSNSESPAEVIREDTYERIDAEKDDENVALRLRIVKPPT